MVYPVKEHDCRITVTEQTAKTKVVEDCPVGTTLKGNMESMRVRATMTPANFSLAKNAD